jgi:hypothetical protein
MNILLRLGLVRGQCPLYKTVLLILATYGLNLKTRKMPYRPEIKLDHSRWKPILLKVHFSILLFGIIYWITNWTHIPDVLDYVNSKGLQKLSKSFLLGYHFTAGQTPIIMNYIVLNSLSRKVGRGRSVSRNLKKAKVQYYIEDSQSFYIFIMAHLFFLASTIISVEQKLHRIYIPDFWWIPFPIFIGITFALHEISWSRFSDK